MRSGEHASFDYSKSRAFRATRQGHSRHHFMNSQPFGELDVPEGKLEFAL